MPAIPAISDFNDAAVTEGEFKTALAGLHDYLTGVLGTAGTQPAALAALGSLIGAGVTAKTGNYTVVAADRGKIISCANSFTLSLTGSATLGAGFAVVVANVGSGTITIDPNASETIDGAATYTVPANTTAIIGCTGTAWVVAGGNPFAKVTGTPDGTKFLRDDLTWQTITVPDVMATIAGASVGAVGTYAFLSRVQASNGSTNPGGTLAGSSLRYAGGLSGHTGTDTISGYQSQSTTAPSGTWRCMGREISTPEDSNQGIPGVTFGSLWLRIS